MIFERKRTHNQAQITLTQLVSRQLPIKPSGRDCRIGWCKVSTKFKLIEPLGCTCCSNQLELGIEFSIEFARIGAEKFHEDLGLKFHGPIPIDN